MRRNGRPRSKHRLRLPPAVRNGQALGLSKPSPVPCRSRKRRNGRPRSKHRLRLPPAGRDGQALGLSKPSPVPCRSRKRLTLRHRESRRFPRRDQTPQDILRRGRLRACHRDSVNANFGPLSDPNTSAFLDQPAFNRKRLKAEKLIDSKVLEQPASKWTRAALEAS